MATITYRETTGDDIEVLARLRWEMEVERDDDDEEVKELPYNDYLRSYVQDLRPAYASGLYRAWVAEVDGEVAACVVLISFAMPPSFEWPHRKRGYVSSVYTRPAHRRKGLAQRLMTMLLDASREAGIQKLILKASSMGEPLYLGLGFEKSNALEIEIEKP